MKRTKPIILQKHATYDLYGDGIVDDAKAFFLGRRRFPPGVRKMLANSGGVRIGSIKVCRRGIRQLDNAVMTKLADLITSGTLAKATKEIGHDKLYHLYLEIKLTSGKSLIMDKQESLGLEPLPDEKPDMCMNVPVKYGSITLENFYNNTFKAFPSKSAFFSYNPKNNNCQVFVRNALRGNNLSSPELENFVMQDTETLFNKTKYGAYLEKLIVGASAVKDRLNIALEGSGNVSNYGADLRADWLLKRTPLYNTDFNNEAYEAKVQNAISVAYPNAPVAMPAQQGKGASNNYNSLISFGVREKENLYKPFIQHYSH